MYIYIHIYIYSNIKLYFYTGLQSIFVFKNVYLLQSHL